MRNYFSGILLFITSLVSAQDVLEYEQFMELVKEFHPQAEVADLKDQRADQVLKAARGGFDPVLSAKIKEKYFQDKSYYNLYSADLSIPTITGIEINAGIDDNSGRRLSTQNYTPANGTGYLGVSVPLGKGMFTDERRTALQIAKQQKEQFQQLSKLTANDLYYEASLTYWNWYQYSSIASALDSAVTVGKHRFDFVKAQFEVGDKAANDTIKAFVQYQDRLQAYYDAKRNAVKYFLDLNTFLWDDSLGLKEGLVPSNSYNQPVSQLQDSLSNEHPSLVYYRAKLKEKEYYKRLKAEKLKPKLNLEYHHLYEGLTPVFEDFGNSQLWGLSFQYPLLIRTERSEFKMAKIKVREAELELKQKERQLLNKITTAQQQLNILNEQLTTLEASLLGYDKLIGAERLKFRLGENSLFELNAWEQRQIANQVKFFKMTSKRNISSAKLSWILVDWE